MSAVRGKHSSKRFAVSELDHRSECCSVPFGHFPLFQGLSSSTYGPIGSGLSFDQLPESEFPLRTTCGRCDKPIQALFEDRDRHGWVIWRTAQYLIKEVPW